MFNNKSKYVNNILSSVPKAVRPSNFLYADILEFLIRHRKEKIDYSVEGYASARTIVNRMSQLGYDEEDAFAALSQLTEWELVQPESCCPISLHASRSAGVIRTEPAAAQDLAELCEAKQAESLAEQRHMIG